MMKAPAAPAAAATLDDLTPEQRALLVLRLRRKAQSEPEIEPIRAPVTTCR